MARTSLPLENHNTRHYISHRQVITSPFLTTTSHRTITIPRHQIFTGLSSHYHNALSSHQNTTSSLLHHYLPSRLQQHTQHRNIAESPKIHCNTTPPPDHHTISTPQHSTMQHQGIATKHNHNTTTPKSHHHHTETTPQLNTIHIIRDIITTSLRHIITTG